MGSCLSCFRSENASTEREPLLPKVAQSPPQSLRSCLDKSADALAAFQAGKLPSQQQLDVFIRTITGSSLLHYDSQAFNGAGPLSENGRRVLNDIREVLESVLQLGMEKNIDDRLQDLLYQRSQIEGPPIHVNADIAIEAGQTGLGELQAQAPTHDELVHDTRKFIKSLKEVARLLLTSTAFRLLLSDIFAAARELLAQTAAEIGAVALQVQVAAETVETAASVEGGSLNDLTGKVGEAVGGVLEGIDEARRHSTAQETTKDAFIGRVQDLIIRAHQDPPTLNALRTLLHIARKYARKLSRSADIISEVQTSGTSGTKGIPAISVSPKSETSHALEDLKILLERLALGHSLDPVLRALSDTITSIADQPFSSKEDSQQNLDLQQYLQAVDRWLSCALSRTPPSQPPYATSRAGTRALENLYDGGRILFLSSSASKPASAWTQHLRALLQAFDAYTTALAYDRSTMRFVNALSALHTDFAHLAALSLGLGTHVGRHAQVWKDEVRRDLLGWVLPRVLGLLGRISVPMPRVEYKSGKLMGALDALRMGCGESGGVVLDVIPDCVVVRTCNEVRIDMADVDAAGTSRTSSSSCSRMRIHIDGVRLAFRELGYFFRYGGKRKVFGYTDQGLLSVDIGSLEHPRSSQGLSLDIDVSLDTDKATGGASESESIPPLFVVRDVRAALPGIRFKIEKSRHWVLNKVLVQQLAGPAVARVVAGVLEARIRTALEGLAHGLAAIHEEARRVAADVRRSGREGEGEDEGFEGKEEEPEAAEYWEALLEKGPDAFGLIFAENREGTVEVETQTNTRATLKGVVHTTTTTTTTAATMTMDGTHPESAPSEPRQVQSETETSVAIGGGAMLFPDKAGAYGNDEEDASANLARVLDQVAQGLEDTLENVGGVVESTVEGAAELGEEIERAEERRVRRKEVEGLRDGWRSRAFDV
ncbi:hypothetical protein D9615_004963 [Tricholomella constricta]|uniref:HAM1-like N-terminal domain-containing protein n=1 Tax=Tricholomella constricta TaxID=117010 RepID=A0A8H5M751_9AGAR|nr:hypothetical protein D9615_004963 [Tricholomella constricta]